MRNTFSQFPEYQATLAINKTLCCLSLTPKLERDRELEKERRIRFHALGQYLGKEHVDPWRYKYGRD
jgi:hypothetical protein